MEQFYFIVLVAASVILILLLTFIGTLLYTSSSTSKFPPTAGICPDYWVINSDKTCKIPQNSGARNIGNVLKNVLTSDNTPGLTGTSINFSHNDWASLYPSTTAFCAKQKWARDNRLEWDGITNSAGCEIKA